ncbi:nitroreductase family protein [Flavobacteriaceae bacterium 14752]|uniref:nitroreductase family protein n=1 Tax=Mesohalobacter salilacus TaxID=2491711 RepID=UPI000F632C5C|nr:nitroreductase [Flavobacteriaceae bacterium 14752]
MDIFECIKHRRSVYPHQFNDEAIPDEDIQKLLKLANWAPTHRKTEPWRFKIFSGDFKDKAGQFFKETYLKTTHKPKSFKAKKIVQKFEQSSHVIAICMQRDPKESLPEWEEIAAAAMAVQNMWLAASTLNIGMYWSTPAYKNELNKLVQLKDREQCFGFLYLGKFNRKMPLLERQSSIEDKTEWFK